MKKESYETQKIA